MQEFLKVQAEDTETGQRNLLLNDRFCITLLPIDLPTRSHRNCLKCSLLFYNTLASIIFCSFDFMMLVLGMKYNHSKSDCPIQPYLVQWLILFGSVGVIICGSDILIGVCTIQNRPNINLCTYCLSLLKISCSLIRIILLILGAILVYSIRNQVQYDLTIAKETYCNRTLYEWTCALIIVQLFFWILSVIVQLCSQIFASGRRIEQI
ncbi:unnamed protein product [Didymodactylos carnosus]|uniref:Uncharacterized protein n=1 Tax=Didymodactylos carnosus TaxID=1234261 RepID=A0A815G1M7_9BILA|nr:unnamed protein product [Didymodactylos carnosus]CAF1332805.1 unnamed protein product [Didymodactylos carnosus]CAF3905626.1 unnamed protein product [Didymodactylos carnosus]CAF4187882.1 unnamed protein product [Didymodactylos carnosus]